MDKEDIIYSIGALMIISSIYCNFIGSVAKVYGKISKRKPKPRKYWVHPLNTVRRRREQGDHFNLIPEMRKQDPKRFAAHLRMKPKIFDKLLLLVAPLITKSSAVREAIDPGTRLELTLRYLASGEGSSSLANQFRVGRSTVPKIIDETVRAIFEVLKNVVLKEPSREDLLNTSEGFWKRWNFPHCIGAIDGKHIAIIAPPESGSENFNYKGFYSTVLLAVCDYRYRFTMVDVGAPGRQSDGGIFRDSNLGKKLERNMMNLPEPDDICVDGPKLPYFLVGDEAFGLKKYLQKPYPGRTTGNLDEGQLVYNYRLSRARRIIENSFGILASKWRIFRQPIHANLERVKFIILAAVCLHNFILIEEQELKPHQRTYLHPTLVDREEDGELVDGDWLTDGEPIHHNTFTSISGQDTPIIENQICIREELN